MISTILKNSFPILALAALPVAAQPAAGTISLDWGAEYKLPKGHDDVGFIGNAKDGYLQIGHDRGESLSLTKFTPGLALGSTRTADISNLPKHYNNEAFITLENNKHYWLFSTYDKSEGVEALFAQEINLADGKLDGSARELVSSEKLAGDLMMTGFYQFTRANKWNLFYSADSGKMLVQTRRTPEKRSDRVNKDVIGFSIFDRNLQKVWSREVRMPYTEEMMDNFDYQIDRNGAVYTLAKVYDSRKLEDRYTPNYHFEILKWTQDGGADATIIPFKLPGKFVQSALIIEDPSGQLVATGYYSTRARTSTVDGAFVLRVTEGGEMVPVYKGSYEIPTSVLEQYEKARTVRRLERAEDKGKEVEANLQLRRAVMNADGSLQLWGEEYYIVVHTVSNGRSTSTYYTYHYNDIVGMSIAADGTRQWIKKIPKEQSGRAGRGDMSFTLFNKGDDRYLFFMDNKKNLDLPVDESPSGYSDGSGGVLTAVRIDANGQMRKSQVYDVREEALKLTVTDFSEVGKGQIITRARGRKGISRPALITFN